MTTNEDNQLGAYIASLDKGGKTEHDCPTFADLSRFMDGKSSYAERKRIIGHLNQCQSCYELFSEALVINEELNTEKEEQVFEIASSPLDKLVAAASSLIGTMENSLKIRYTAPVVAILLIAVLVAFKPEKHPGYKTVASSLDGVEISHHLVNQLKKLPYGSAAFGFFDGLSLERAAFRIGVLTYSLEIAVRARDAEQSNLLIKPLLSLLGELDEQGKVVSNLREVHFLLSNGSFPESISRHTEPIEPLMQQQDVGFFMVFGSWVQAGSLAASANDPLFFEKSDLPYYQDEANKLGLPPGIERSLKSIAQTLERDSLSGQDFEKIKQSFDTILHILM